MPLQKGKAAGLCEQRTVCRFNHPTQLAKP